jgi:hypothetical protein
MRQGQMAEIPWFQVRTVEASPARLIGSLSSTRYGKDIWVKAGWLGNLRVGDRFVSGRWSKAGLRWVFSLSDATELELVGQSRWLQAYDGYWAERAELVLNKALVWALANWQEPPEHDHCAICWATICVQENAVHYMAKPNYRVCSACYAAYVQPHNINFRELNGPAA